jgi:hypothetical protein
MLNIFKKKIEKASTIPAPKTNKVNSTNRRGFLQQLGVLFGAAATAPVLAKANSIDSIAKSQNPQSTDFLKKTWKQDFITFYEYELPANVPAYFKAPNRPRPIYCPMRKLDENKSYTVKKRSLYTTGLPMLQSKSAGEEQITEQNLIDYHIDVATMHYKSGGSGPSVSKSVNSLNPWNNPKIYIVRVKDKPDLFGIMINKDELTVETNTYAIYGS